MIVLTTSEQMAFHEYVTRLSGASERIPDSESLKSNSHYQPPKHLQREGPKYPLSARRNGEQGVVLMAAILQKNGRLTDVMVLSSSGSRTLDQASLSAFSTWAYQPALLDGQPITIAIWSKFSFRLGYQTVV